VILVRMLGAPTSDQTVGTVYALLERAGKSPMAVQNRAPGFIANRLHFALQPGALYIVEEGIVTPKDIDRLVRDGFGRCLSVAGPFDIAELIGWDLEL
jgi:3-hydroxyacyl-CoA dehydrogenase